MHFFDVRFVLHHEWYHCMQYTFVWKVHIRAELCITCAEFFSEETVHIKIFDA